MKLIRWSFAELYIVWKENHNIFLNRLKENLPQYLYKLLTLSIFELFSKVSGKYTDPSEHFKEEFSYIKSRNKSLR